MRFGEKADVRSGRSDTTGSLGAGPAERAGEQLDEAEKEQRGR